jgi:hypothetical protein
LANTTIIDGQPAGPAGSGGGCEPTELVEVTEHDTQRLLAILLGGPDSPVTWRRAQILTLAVQRISTAAIAAIVGVDSGDVWSVIENFNREGFDSLRPAWTDPQAI